MDGDQISRENVFPYFIPEESQSRVKRWDLAQLPDISSIQQSASDPESYYAQQLMSTTDGVTDARIVPILERETRASRTTFN